MTDHAGLIALAREVECQLLRVGQTAAAAHVMGIVAGLEGEDLARGSGDGDILPAIAQPRRREPATSDTVLSPEWAVLSPEWIAEFTRGWACPRCGAVAGRPCLRILGAAMVGTYGPGVHVERNRPMTEMEVVTDPRAIASALADVEPTVAGHVCISGVAGPRTCALNECLVRGVCTRPFTCLSRPIVSPTAGARTDEPHPPLAAPDPQGAGGGPLSPAVTCDRCSWVHHHLECPLHLTRGDAPLGVESCHDPNCFDRDCPGTHRTLDVGRLELGQLVIVQTGSGPHTGPVRLLDAVGVDLGDGFLRAVRPGDLEAAK